MISVEKCIEEKQQFLKSLLLRGESFEMSGLFLTWPRRSNPRKCCGPAPRRFVHASLCFSERQHMDNNWGLRQKWRIVCSSLRFTACFCFCLSVKFSQAAVEQHLGVSGDKGCRRERGERREDVGVDRSVTADSDNPRRLMLHFESDVK